MDNSNCITDNENCARILRPIWVRNGIVAASAFNLRTKIKETYISVLRESIQTFKNDVRVIVKQGTNTPYSSMSIQELKTTVLSINENNINFDVEAVDNNKLKSHAGLFVSVNGQRVIGGEPFQTNNGQPVDAIMLKIKLELAKIASKNIKTLQL